MSAAPKPLSDAELERLKYALPLTSNVTWSLATSKAEVLRLLATIDALKAVPLADDAELIDRLRANAKVCREERGRDLPEASKRELENDAREWDDAADALEQRSAALRAVRELCDDCYLDFPFFVGAIRAAMENAK